MRTGALFYLPRNPQCLAKKKISAHYLFVERKNKKNKKWQKMNENNAKSGLLKEPVGKKLISQD